MERGKPHFAREFLPREADCPEFINVDLIAAGLSPFAAEKAALHRHYAFGDSSKNHPGRELCL